MVGKQNIHFVLVESETSANVGAVARAMKNTGFSQLHLINPQCDVYDDDAQALAHRSFDIIENAKRWSSLAELRAEFTFLVATTADQRDTKKNYIAANKLGTYLLDASHSGNAAIVFGRERNGLTTDEITMCDFVSSLPLATPSPTINLSQAVMLYAYLISNLEDQEPVQIRDELVLHPEENKVFQGHMDRFLAALGLSEKDRAYAEVQSRLPLIKARDKRLMMFLLSRLRHKFGL